MNFFKNTTFTWWQIGMFKLSVFTIGIAAGTYWHEVFASYLTLLVTVGIVSGLYIATVWFAQR
jgi:uncharacterized membrane protein YgaE (UPF0421/DUF939 family)